ncbi:family 43 glycosylhydrolase [Zunongwangia sp.]|uniref:family 43 glycosylhydrolase n=1 Tax=Zunongwangia sp. TaxID=1965325 RepID=UPI003AA7D6C2
MSPKLNYTFLFGILFLITDSFAQNPLIHDQFTADPTARVFEGKIYVFPSHDIVPPEGEGRKDWFNMSDYHVFSSSNLTNWEDHGVIVSQDEVDWVASDSYSMWAPDCVEKNSKYYFYFPSMPKNNVNTKGFAIGVAVAQKPEGPYKIEEKPIDGVNGIDPNVFIDKDGTAYLYWSARNFYVAKLKDNMKELAEEPVEILNLPTEGLKEGPFVFERNGTYYLTYPHVANKTERLEYATAPSPTGPFEVQGVIMDESPSGCWTNHHSIVNYKSQWYLFYHHNDYSPEFDKLRSIRADSLSFDTTGKINKVKPTLRGVGVVKATDKIQLDRYSAKSEDAKIAFNNQEYSFEGWHVVLNHTGSWVRFNFVEMEKDLDTIQLRMAAETDGILEMRFDDKNRTLLSKVPFSKTEGFNTLEIKLKKYQSGKHNILLLLKSGKVKIDWLSFK